MSQQYSLCGTVKLSNLDLDNLIWAHTVLHAAHTPFRPNAHLVAVSHVKKLKMLFVDKLLNLLLIS